MEVGVDFQIPLIAPMLPESLPTDAGRYVAVVQTKSGERNALARTTAATWERLMPVVELLGPKNPPSELGPNWPRDWTRELAKSLAGHPFYFDTLRLSPSHPVTIKAGTTPVLPYLYAWARRRGMAFVPVVHAGQSGAKQVRYISDAALEDRRGVAVRYRILSAVPAAGKRHSDVLADQLSDLNVNVGDADLLIDLGALDPDQDIEAEDLADALVDANRVGRWRCVVLLGTSIPKMLGVIKEGTVGAIPRREWQLWIALRNLNPERLPAFGDYVIQHPDPPAEDINGNTMRANVRYTDTDQTVIARGRGPVSQEGAEQYHDLCGQIVNHPSFRGADYSWGDSLIAACAAFTCDPAAQPTWRGAGTSHHLQLVTDQVRALTP